MRPRARQRLRRRRLALAHAVTRDLERVPLALAERLGAALLELPDELFVAHGALVRVAGESIELAERRDRARLTRREQKRTHERIFGVAPALLRAQRKAVRREHPRVARGERDGARELDLRLHHARSEERR